MARMSAAHLAPQGGGFEPQRKYDFEINLFGVPGAELIKLACVSAGVPDGTNEVINLPYLNEVIKVAGQAKWASVPLVVRDFVDQPVYSALMAWRKLVQDPATGNTGLASTYKKQGELSFIGPDGAAEKKFKMIGIWPSSVKDEGVSYAEGTAVHTITMTLECDKAMPLF